MDSSNNQSDVASKVYIGFIDVLFGVIIGVSFTDFKQILVPIAFKFETFTLLLAYVTVIASWIGYHIAIEKKPDKSIHRFIVDLIILYLYFYLIYSVQDFSIVVMLFPVIFGFYIIWDLTRVMEDYKIKIEEYKKQKHLSLHKKPSITYHVYYSIWGSSWNKINTIFFVLFMVQLVLYHSLVNVGLMQQHILLDGTLLEWSVWVTSLAMLVIYRQLKEVSSTLTIR